MTMLDKDCGCPGPCDHPLELADTPELDELYQVDEDRGTLVRTAGPTSVDILPTRWGGSGTLTLPAAAVGVQPVQLLGDDPRRARVTLVVVGAANVGIGPSQADCDLRPAIITEAASPLPLTPAGELWVKAIAAAAQLTYIVEHWSR